MSALSDQVAAVEADRDDLARRIEELRESYVEGLRRAYRRGYWAGRASAKRGDGPVTNPECHARGDLGKVLR